jgi:hypothetical protein
LQIIESRNKLFNFDVWGKQLYSTESTDDGQFITMIQQDLRIKLVTSPAWFGGDSAG